MRPGRVARRCAVLGLDLARAMIALVMIGFALIAALLAGVIQLHRGATWVLLRAGETALACRSRLVAFDECRGEAPLSPSVTADERRGSDDFDPHAGPSPALLAFVGGLPGPDG